MVYEQEEGLIELSKFKNVNQELPEVKDILELPDFLLTNDYSNPYSEPSLGIPPGEGYLADVLKTQSTKQETKKEEYVPQTTTNPGDKRAYVKKLLIETEGLSSVLASALTGVWYAESRLNPRIHEIGKENNEYAGKGIAQWTGKYRLKHVEDLYKKIYGKSKRIKEMSLEEQVKVAVAEFKERTGNWRAFINSNNIETAVDIVWRGYENGSANNLATMSQMNNAYHSANIVSNQWKTRLRYAKQIYNL